MMLRYLPIMAFCGLALAGCSSPAPSASPSPSVSTANLQAALHGQLAQYLAKYGKAEHVSAIAASVSPAGGSTPDIQAVAGTTTFGGTTPAQADELVQIGSNTKAFTSVLLLQLEAEGRLSIDDPLGKYLPQYPAWKNITIRRLLNMTSGIPTYDAEPKWLADYDRNPYRYLSPQQLIAYVYPKVAFAPGKRWEYSNTAYVLAEMIVERVTGHTYALELQRKLFTPLSLRNTYYSDHIYPAAVLSRMPAGYFDNRNPGQDLTALFGRDLKGMSVSWARGAGAIVASLPDVTHWSRDLFRGPLLPDKQRAEMTTLVSLKTGQPVAASSENDPRTFGLGVAQFMAPREGSVWFYEGETLGYRTLYEYFPKKDVVLAVSLNSQPTVDNVGKLMEALYGVLRKAGMV